MITYFPLKVNAVETISCNDERKNKLSLKIGTQDAYEFGVGIVPLDITKWHFSNFLDSFRSAFDAAALTLGGSANQASSGSRGVGCPE